MKIDNIESAIAAIESAGYTVHKEHYLTLIPRLSGTYGIQHKDAEGKRRIIAVNNDKELIEFASKCALKAF